MRLMERIRRYGQLGLIVFIVIFVISVFAGLGVSTFSLTRDRGREQEERIRAGKQAQLQNEGEYKDAAMVVNGRPIKDELLNTTLNNVFSRAQLDANDPGYQFQAYGEVGQYLIRQELVMAKAEELGVKVTSDDLKAEKEKVSAQYQPANATAGTGNVVGDFAKKMSANRYREKAFEEFLMRSGQNEQQWEQETRRTIMSRKTVEAIQAQLDAELKVEATATKAKVDEDLKNGVVFTEVVKKYSTGPAAETGGDLGTWLQRGLLFSEEAEDILFKTPKGQISEWIEIPAGFQRFEVYDKVEAEGPEFEAAKAGIIEGIKTDKGADYAPTDEEIAEKYEKVKARQLIIKTTTPGAAEEKIAEEMKAAQIEINNPIILAFQAVYGDRLQPPSGYELEQLQKIAQNSAAAEGFDYSIIIAKLKKGQPELPKVEEQPADATAAPAADPVAAAGAPAGDGTENAATPAPASAPAPADGTAAPSVPTSASAADAAPADPTMQADGTTPVPVYALGIGLLKLALQEQEQTAGPFLHYMLAKLYLDWLKDEDLYNTQPMDRPKARQEIEDNLAQVVKSFEYSPLVHAYRGLNLAWLEQADEARKELELAQKYAPADDQSEAWEILKDAYEVLDDSAKMAEIDALLNQLRRERMQRQIQEAQARQQAQQAQTPFQPGAGQPPAAPPATPPAAPPAAPPAVPPAQGGE